MTGFGAIGGSSIASANTRITENLSNNYAFVASAEVFRDTPQIVKAYTFFVKGIVLVSKSITTIPFIAYVTATAVNIKRGLKAVFAFLDLIP